MKLSTPIVLLDKYRVEREIGHGGMGHVYAATHLAMGRQVAIKVLRSELCGDPSLVERFSREVVATARINNPYVVSVYDVDRLADGTLFIVMDLLRGETLRQRMERGPIPRRECIDILLETAAGLSAAHAAGVTHRDLKPENIFLVFDPEPQVKVVDFGIAKLEGTTSITALNAMMGTPAYMSPEQLVSVQNTGPRSDLWSLGVVAFELLTGRPPFNGDSLPGLCAAILGGESPKFADLSGLEEGLRTRRLEMPGAGAGATRPKRGRIRALDCPLRLDPRATGPRDDSPATASEAVQQASDATTLPRSRDEQRISPDGPTEAVAWSHTPTQNARMEAQGSVNAVVAPRSRGRRWAWLGIGAVLSLGAGAWHMRDAPARHTTRGAAAASLSWLSRQADNASPARPDSGPVREPTLRFRAEAPGQSIQGVGFSVDGQVISTFSGESGRVRLWSHEYGTRSVLCRPKASRGLLRPNDYALTKTAKGVLTQWSLMNGISVGTTKLESAIAFGGSNDLEWCRHGRSPGDQHGRARAQTRSDQLASRSFGSPGRAQRWPPRGRRHAVSDVLVCRSRAPRGPQARVALRVRAERRHVFLQPTGHDHRRQRRPDHALVASRPGPCEDSSALERDDLRDQQRKRRRSWSWWPARAS